MSKNEMSKSLRKAKLYLFRRSPEILVGLGIAGMVRTVIVAVQETPKAMRLIEEKKEEMDAEELSIKDTIAAAWTCYIPATIIGSISIACIVGGNYMHVRRNAALATAYSLSETFLKEYQEKVVETIGEKKERGVRDAIAKDRLEQNPVTTREIILTGKGDSLCYDAMTGRYFKSDIEKLRKAENELNRKLLNEMYISLNEFYDEIGLSPTNAGDDLGWNVNDGLIELDFSSQLVEDGTPCLVVDYRCAPRYDYTKLM